MKRDWDLLRKQLTDVEEDRDVLFDIPAEPKWVNQTEAEYTKLLKEYNAIERRIGGHLELLVENGFIDGLTVIRSAEGFIHFSVSCPRLTMAGHDLLDTMRSSSLWEKIKSSAKDKGIELTFDTIKTLGGLALKQIIQ